jgi:hypothetical protein
MTLSNCFYTIPDPLLTSNAIHNRFVDTHPRDEHPNIYLRMATRRHPRRARLWRKLLDLADLRYNYHIIAAQYCTPQANLSQNMEE